MNPDAIKKFTELLTALPGIGPRQAIRLAYHLVNEGKATIDELARGVSALGSLANCTNCFMVAKLGAGGLCPICADPKRNQNLVAIVEKDTDLMSLEQAKKFNGTYLVLGELAKDGFLSPPQKLRLNFLKSRAKQFPERSIAEVVVALNPTSYGDIQAALIIDELKSFAKKITRLGRGLPTGGEIEFADEETLGGAIEHRS